MTYSSAFHSEETAANGKDVMNATGGLGFAGSIDWRLFSPITLGLGFIWSKREATVQYVKEGIAAKDMKADSDEFSFDAGLRLRFINTQRFKWYVGGGYVIGSQSLGYNSEEFEEKTGDDKGFQLMDSARYQGYFLETGIEYILSNVSGLRFSAKQQYFESEKFKTLDDKSVTSDYLRVGIQYMHYVDWSLFWK